MERENNSEKDQTKLESTNRTGDFVGESWFVWISVHEKIIREIFVSINNNDKHQQ